MTRTRAACSDLVSAPPVLITGYRPLTTAFPRVSAVIVKGIDSMASWQIAVLMISDLMVYCTYPVHLRFLYVLLKKKNQDFDHSYQVLLTNLTIFNILFGTSYAFIQEPAAHGLAPDFFASATQILGRIELIKATALVFCMSFHMLIGLNRLTAFAVPMKHAKIWSQRNVKILCLLVWAVVIGMAIPIIVCPSARYAMSNNFFGVNSVEYRFEVGPFRMYPLVSMIFTGVFEVAKVLIYIGILILMQRNKSFQVKIGTYQKFSKNIKRMTFAAAVNSSGGWISFLFFLTYYVYQWATGELMVNFTNYSLCLRFIVAFNNMLTPWVMLATFRNMRDLFMNRKREQQQFHTVSRQSSAI